MHGESSTAPELGQQMTSWLAPRDRMSFLRTKQPSTDDEMGAPGIVLMLNQGSRVSIITSVCHCQLCMISNKSFLLSLLLLPNLPTEGIGLREYKCPFLF